MPTLAQVRCALPGLSLVARHDSGSRVEETPTLTAWDKSSTSEAMYSHLKIDVSDFVPSNSLAAGNRQNTSDVESSKD